jgi:hypothetical protein
MASADAAGFDMICGYQSDRPEASADPATIDTPVTNDEN